MGLTSGQARRFYDRFGRAQDLQAFYEDRATGDLLAHGRFDDARAVLEADWAPAVWLPGCLTAPCPRTPATSGPTSAAR